MTTRETIIGILGLIGLWGCSGETVEPETGQQAAICLAGGLPEETAVTRADQGLEEVLPSNDKTFMAWGYKNNAVNGSNYTNYQTVMPGYIVSYGASTAYTTTSNTRDWEYVGQGTDQDIKYWDFAAEAYRFFGYAPSSATLTKDTSNPDQVSFSTAVNASTQAGVDAAPYFSELWFSNDKTNDYGKPVTLRFIKPFARVRFMFTFVDGLFFGREALTNIRFCPTVNLDNDNTNNQTIANAGTVTVTYPLTGTATKESWSTSNTTGISEFPIDYYEQPITLPQGFPVNGQSISWPNTPHKWYYVLPVESQSSYTIQVSVVTTEIKTAVVPAEYMSWKAGYEYTYKFKITESGGVAIDIVQVAINDWGNRQTRDHAVYNW